LYSSIDAAVQQIFMEVSYMPAAVKSEFSRTHPREPSFVSLLSGWAQQGVQTLFSTQRILIDLVMRQNASVMHALRQHLSDPHHSPTAILSEVAGEGMSNFIEGQTILLQLAQQQSEILMGGVKERMGNWPAAHALTDLLRRSLDTFVEMQQEFLKIAEKQTHSWIEAAKAGKPYQSEHLVKAAHEAMENFVKAQKQFLDVITDETLKATGGKPVPSAKKIKKTELSELAREATKSFVDAQKKLFDVAGRQMSANVKTVGKTLEFAKLPSIPLAELTREGVQSYVDAQKALMDVMLKPGNGHKPGFKGTRKKTHRIKKQAAAAGAA
jgi:HEPN domain-containing protein